jgi:hypothetical protein
MKEAALFPIPAWVFVLIEILNRAVEVIKDLPAQ